jgi:hypothetical protein
VTLAGIAAAPATADVYPWYYEYQTASWEAANPPDPTVKATPRDAVQQADQPGQIDKDAFLEKQPLEDLTSKDELETPVQAGDVTDDCDKCGNGGKGGGAGCWRPCWQFSMDALIMRREHMDTVPLVVDGAGATLLDADDIGLSHRGGMRLSAARQIINCRNDIEFEFFFVDQWSALTTVDTPGAQVLVYGATFGTDPITVGYGNDLYSFELNWRRAWCSDRLKTLIGFRVMELDENMRIVDAGSPPDLFQGDVDNHLIGFQIGLEGTIYDGCRLQVEGGLKAGIYHNEADFDAAFPQAGQGAMFRAARDHTTFAGELWLGANYYVTDRLAVRAGYQAMWIEGVAVLPEQLDDLAVPILGDLDMGGSPFYHGWYFGAQFDW